MATTSKLNNNLLLLSSKRTQNLRRSLCRFKSLKFGANSNFSNSTSSAPIINNAAVSFYSDSSQQPKFSIKRAASDEVKSSGSTNKNNLFDAVKNNALNLLKYKVKVAAALMMLGMMMINGHKRKPAFALAFPGQGGHLFSASSSSSLAASSSPRGCPLCSHGCIFCADQPTTKDGSTIDSDLKFLVFAIHFIICLAMAVLVFLVVVLVDLFKSSFTSIFKIQLGLLDSEDLQRDLNFIKQTLNKSSYSARPSVLEDAIKVLDWHSNNCLFSYSSVSEILYCVAKFSMVMANVEIVNMSRCYSLNMFKEFVPMGVFSRQVNKVLLVNRLNIILRKSCKDNDLRSCPVVTVIVLYAAHLVSVVPTTNKEVEIPPVAEASNLEDSAGEEAFGSGSASTSKEVTRSNSFNFNNSFNPVISMKFEIDKFDGTGDFRIWRRKVKALLSHQKILKAINDEHKSNMLEIALGTIILNLSDNVLREVNDETTAYGVWNKLESLYMLSL
ncbi:hypothetical protein EZV62_024396 [Acer yangbiense]|uniref:Uncharacterized protein n=1 Tax=Acer yangbiense TaxID=1000413 RepID=A0A5C7GUW2_9ROSI|nr:hypothetical protein EZV62_024396 [Acer yangbiense]